MIVPVDLLRELVGRHAPGRRPSFTLARVLVGRYGSSGFTGFTGFTGTMLLVRPDHGLTLLTNRGHPSRGWSDSHVSRLDVIGVIATGSAER